MKIHDIKKYKKIFTNNSFLFKIQINFINSLDFSKKIRYNKIYEIKNYSKTRKESNVKNSKDWNKILYISIGALCVLSIIAGIYAQFFVKDADRDNVILPTGNQIDEQER